MMENKEDILKKLQSEDIDILNEAIKEIKENGDISITDSLLALLSSKKDARVITSVINLLADIKENAFKEILIQHLRATTDPSLKSMLLRIVWESSLNYSSYLDLFIDILLNDEFTVAFEASTVIENMVYNLTSEQQQHLHSILEDTTNENRKFLLDNIREELEKCREEEQREEEGI